MDEAIARKAKNIKVLFRGVSKDNPHKAIMGVQAEKGVIGKHIQENFDNLKKIAQIWVLLFQVPDSYEMLFILFHIFRWLKLFLD